MYEILIEEFYELEPRNLEQHFDCYTYLRKLLSQGNGTFESRPATLIRVLKGIFMLLSFPIPCLH